METTTRSRTDSTFPPSLLDLAPSGLSSCERLRTRGPWPPQAGIAIVGTRQPDEPALAFTRALAAEICAAGLAVWSGGARGIDAAAHEGALDAGGRTVVVVPSGVDRPYPREHASLFDRVLDRGGTVVSPFTDDAPPMVPSFHKRNAVLAALTFATVVVQAGVKSGARSTARAAKRLGRPLFVVPHPPWDPRGSGCALELVGGATAIVSSATLLARLRDRILGRAAFARDDRFLEEIAHELTTEAAPKRRPRSAPSRSASSRAANDLTHLAASDHTGIAAHDLTRLAASDRASVAAHDHTRIAAHDHTRIAAHDHTRIATDTLAREHASREHACTRTLHELPATAKRVLEAIGEVPIHMDDLCERTALPAASVTAALLTLTLGAVVVEAPAGYYRLSTI